MGAVNNDITKDLLDWYKTEAVSEKPPKLVLKVVVENGNETLKCVPVSQIKGWRDTVSFYFLRHFGYGPFNIQRVVELVLASRDQLGEHGSEICSAVAKKARHFNNKWSHPFKVNLKAILSLQLSTLPAAGSGLLETFSQPSLGYTKRAVTELPSGAIDASKWRSPEVPVDKPAQQALRKEIYEQTKQASQYGYVVDGQHVQITPEATEAMQKSVKVYSSIPPPKSGWPRHCAEGQTTEIEVLNKDAFEVAEQLVRDGHKPLVLNMANSRIPGGGVGEGSGAQEETLHRCSNYHLALDPANNQFHPQKTRDAYAIPEGGVILTEGVSVFRERGTGPIGSYTFKKEPFQVGIVAGAAYDISRRVGGGLSEEERAHTKETLLSILRCAAMNGYDSLVLGSLGCGAFDDDAATNTELVQQTLCDILSGPEFQGVFKKISFAILCFNPTDLSQPRPADKGGKINRLFAEFKHLFHGRKQSEIRFDSRIKGVV